MRLDYAVVVSSVSSFPTAHCSSRSLFVLQIGLTCLSLCLSLFQTTTTTQTTTQKRKQKQAKPANAAMLQLIVGFLVGAVFVSIFSGSGSNYSVRFWVFFGRRFFFFTERREGFFFFLSTEEYKKLFFFFFFFFSLSRRSPPTTTTKVFESENIIAKATENNFLDDELYRVLTMTLLLFSFSSFSPTAIRVRLIRFTLADVWALRRTLFRRPKHVRPAAKKTRVRVQIHDVPIVIR